MKVTTYNYIYAWNMMIKLSGEKEQAKSANLVALMIVWPV